MIEDFASKMTTIRMAAEEMNNHDAQYFLGMCYLTGVESMLKSDIEAMKWLKRAAINGNIEATYQLGLLYGTGGDGIEQDPVLSLTFLSVAAKNGHELAKQAHQQCVDLMEKFKSSGQPSQVNSSSYSDKNEIPDFELLSMQVKFFKAMGNKDYRAMDAIIRQGLNMNYALSESDVKCIMMGMMPKRLSVWPPPRDQKSWWMSSHNPLCDAIGLCDYGAVGKLIDAGADVNFRFIRFAVHPVYALRSAIALYPEYRKIDIIEWLLYKGARYNFLDLKLIQNNEALKRLFAKYQNNYTSDTMKVTLSEEAIDHARETPAELLVRMIMTDEEVKELTRLGIYNPELEKSPRAHCDESSWWPAECRSK